MNGALQAALAIVAGIITVAIVAVIVGQKSQAPAAIAATGGLLSTVIGAAVNPISATAANNPLTSALSSANIGGNLTSNLGANSFTSLSSGLLSGSLL